MFALVEELLAMGPISLKAEWANRRQLLLKDKIDYTKFLTWFIENYPASAEQTKIANATSDTTFWSQFK